MGSIVKTIGKVIKKIGKALKKIAPILLVAAAAYVGYGYMTGFQAGGWPQITEWGKSLMVNVSSGMPLSEAAMSADPSILADAAPQAQTFPYSGPGSVAGTPLDVTTTPPLESGLLGTQPSTDGLFDLGVKGIDTSANIPEMATDPAGMISAMGETGASVAEAGGLISGPRINPLFDSMASEYESTGLVDSFSDYLVNQKELSTITPTGDYQAMGPFDKVSEWIGDTFSSTGDPTSSTGGATGEWISDFPDTTITTNGSGATGSWGPSVSETISADIPRTWSPNTLTSSGFTADRNLPGSVFGSNTGNVNFSGRSGIGEASNVIMSWGGKAWGVFKAAIEKNPGMAMWTAVNIMKFVAELLDKSDEQESYASRHVMGFGPGNYADMAEKYGGMPTSKKSDFWKSVDAGNQGRLTASSKVKTGTKPMGNTRISAINRSPGGIIGPTKQVQV